MRTDHHKKWHHLFGNAHNNNYHTVRDALEEDKLCTDGVGMYPGDGRGNNYATAPGRVPQGTSMSSLSSTVTPNPLANDTNRRVSMEQQPYDLPVDENEAAVLAEADAIIANANLSIASHMAPEYALARNSNQGSSTYVAFSNVPLSTGYAGFSNPPSSSGYAGYTSSSSESGYAGLNGDTSNRGSVKETRSSQCVVDVSGGEPCIRGRDYIDVDENEDTSLQGGEKKEGYAPFNMSFPEERTTASANAWNRFQASAPTDEAATATAFAIPKDYVRYTDAITLVDPLDEA